MIRTSRAVLFAAFFIIVGCSPAPPPRQAVVSDMDNARKQAFIAQTRSALKIFLASARDLRHRHNNRAREELAAQVDRFVEQQVEPIGNDFEANNTPQTRLEVAELQLICSLVYLDLGQSMEAWRLLDEMQRRYGKDRELLDAALDPRQSGFANLRAGIPALKKRAVRETLGLSLPSSL